MDKLEALKIFFAVAEQRSFTGAARSLGIAPSRATRAIAALEKSLGVTLLRRSTRAVGLTEEGATYLERSRGAVTELDQAAALISSGSAEPAGLLTISAPISFGRMHVLPVVSSLLKAHPELKVRLQLLDRTVSLAEEGVDVAVRIGELPDSSLHATKLTWARHILTASPEYLALAGSPRSPSDLPHHRLIAFEGLPGAGSIWPFSSEQKVVIAPCLTVNSADGVVQAACDGIGIARTYSYQVEQQVSCGNLIRLLPEFEPAPVPISAVYQAGRRSARNIRAVIDALAAYLAKRAFQCP